jgi:hypothetical protein
MKWWTRTKTDERDITAADRRAARRMIRRLEQCGVVPEPWNLGEFISRLADWRGRPIRVIGKPGEYWATGDDGDYLSGLYVPHPQVDIILHRTDGGPATSEHIVLHEVGHMIYDHICAPDIHPDALDDTAAPRDVLQSSCARSRLCTPEERRVEAFAVLMITTAGERGTPEQRRLAEILGRRI